MRGAVPSQVAPTAQAFDRHSGVNETSWAALSFFRHWSIWTRPHSRNYCFHLTSRECFRWRPPETDRAAIMLFLAEALKPKETGKNTSTAEMSPTGVWS
jgi:hypothetical protein